MAQISLQLQKDLKKTTFQNLGVGGASAPVDTHDFIVKSEHIETVEKVKFLE